MPQRNEKRYKSSWGVKILQRLQHFPICVLYTIVYFFIILNVNTTAVYASLPTLSFCTSCLYLFFSLSFFTFWSVFFFFPQKTSQAPEIDYKTKQNNPKHPSWSKTCFKERSLYSFGTAVLSFLWYFLWLSYNDVLLKS